MRSSRSHSSRRLDGTALWVIAGFVLLPVLARLTLRNPEKDGARPPIEMIQAGKEVRGSLEAGERHEYLLALHSEDYLEAVVDENGINLTAEFFDPRDKRLFAIGPLEGPIVPLAFRQIVRVDGEYRLRLTADKLGPLRGGYRIMAERRPATSQDGQGVLAFQTFADAWAAYSRGDDQSLREALAGYQETIEISRSIRDQTREALALKHLAEVREAFNQINQAEQTVRQALGIFRQLGDDVMVHDCLTALGYYARRDGRYPEAIDSLRIALKDAENLGDRFGEAAALNGLGILYRSRGNLPAALEFLESALSIYRRLGHRSRIALTLENLGTTYSFAGNWETALDYLREALSIDRETDDLRSQIYVLTQIGWVHSLQGRHLPAVEFYRQARELLADRADFTAELALLTRWGNAYRELGKTDDAIHSYVSALDVAVNSGDPRSRAATQSQLAELWIREGRPDAALPYLRAAESYFAKPGNLDEKAHLSYLDAQTEALLDHMPESRILAQQALDQVEEMRSDSGGAGMQATYWASRQDYLEFFIDLLMRQWEADPSSAGDEAAFEASQSNRARWLLDILARPRIDERDVDPEFLDEERRLQGEVRRKLLRARPSSPDAARRYDREIRDLLLNLDKARLRLNQSLPPPDSQPSEISLREMQRDVLDPNTLLLAYSLGKGRSFLWLVSQNSFESFVLPDRAAIESRAEELHRLLAGGDRALSQQRIEGLSGVLGEILLGPVSDRLGEKRVLVSAEGILQTVPFQILEAPSAGGQGPPEALVRHHEVIAIPSPAVLLEIRRRQSETPPALLELAVFADPVFQPSDPRVVPGAASSVDTPLLSLRRADALEVPRDYKRLPASRQEAEAILALVPEEKSFRRFGFEASREELLAAHLERYRILHLATHGEVYPSQLGAAGVVLSLLDEQGLPADGFLSTQEVADLRLNADLVVISACGSALGRPLRGEGLISLSHGFLRAGASSVVVALWDVNDIATATLMESFYRKMLVEGMPPASALRAAQLEMASDPQWQSPFYWAGFVLQGDWR